MEQQLDLQKQKKKRTISREMLEYELMNAHVALQTNQFEKAQSFLDKLKNERLPVTLLPRYYALCGEAKIGLRLYEEALVDFEQSLQLFERKGRTPTLEIERVRNWLGLAYYYLNKYQLAIEQHERCLKAIQRGWIEDKRFKMKIYTNLANEYHHLGNHQETLQLYREAIKLAEGGEDNSALAGIYWGLGLTYRSIDNLAMAKLYLDKSADLYQQLGELDQAGRVRTMLGLALVNRKEFSEAEVALKSALQLGLESKDEAAQGTAYANLAFLYREQRDLVRAEQNARRALEILHSLDDKVLLGQALGELAEIKILQEAISEGLALFEQAIAILEQTESSEYLKKLCFRYASTLEKIGNLREAVKMFKRAYYYQNQEHKKKV